MRQPGMRKEILLIGLCLALVSGSAWAGKLDDYEKAATRPKPSTRAQTDRESDGDCHGFLSCFLDALLQSSSSSDDSADDEASSSAPAGDDQSTADEPSSSSPVVADRGTATLGTGFDIAYQSAGTGVWAYDLSIMGHLGAVDIGGRITHYVEASPPDTLDINQVNLTLPVKLGESLTMGGGIGLYQLAGNNTNTGLSLSLPFLLHEPGNSWQVRITPLVADINGNTISDVDVRAGYRRGPLALLAGYREMRAGAQLLGGPYLGAGYFFQ